MASSPCLSSCKSRCLLVGWVCASAGVVAVQRCRAEQEHLLPQVVCCCAANALPLDEEHQYLRTFAGGSEHDNNVPDLLERQSWRTRTRSSIRMARISFVAAVLPLTCILRGLLNLQVFNYLWRWSAGSPAPRAANAGWVAQWIRILLTISVGKVRSP